MKLKTKLLIIASACLVALSLAACGGESGQEDKTSPATDEAVTADVTNNTESDNETQKLPEAGTVDNAPDDSRPSADTQSSDNPNQDDPAQSGTANDPSNETEGDTKEAVGPQPPAPETEPEVTMPDFEGVETNDNGVIELPFVPFD